MSSSLTSTLIGAKTKYFKCFGDYFRYFRRFWYLFKVSEKRMIELNIIFIILLNSLKTMKYIFKLILIQLSKAKLE